ncbi:HCP-like protein, partial [Backusella circina FSU 941]
MAYNLGIMFYEGLGIEQDYTKAMHYFTVAANQGHAVAQSQLGFFYDKGYGTDQDWTKARKWYTKAANQNNSIANHN